jgi:hypothetical protein
MTMTMTTMMMMMIMMTMKVTMTMMMMMMMIQRIVGYCVSKHTHVILHHPWLQTKPKLPSGHLDQSEESIPSIAGYICIIFIFLVDVIFMRFYIRPSFSP